MGLSGGTSAKCEERYTRPLRTLRSPLAGRPPRSRKFCAANVRSSAKSITRRGCSAASRVLSSSFGKSEIVLNHYHLYSALRSVERRLDRATSCFAHCGHLIDLSLVSCPSTPTH